MPDEPFYNDRYNKFPPPFNAICQFCGNEITTEEFYTSCQDRYDPDGRDIGSKRYYCNFNCFAEADEVPF